MTSVDADDTERQSRRLRILHIITGLRQGGAEGVLVRLIGSTRADVSHRVVVLGDAGYFGPKLQSEGIPVRALGLDPRFGSVMGLFSLFRVIRSERPDVVQTWLYHADLLGGVAAALARARPIVWCIRNNNLDAASIGRSTRLVARMCSWLSGSVPDAITFNSDAASRAHVRFGYAGTRIRRIDNGYDLDRFRPDPALRDATRAALGIKGSQKLIGTVARWDRQKDHATLIAAMSAITDASVRLLLVGSGMDTGNAALISRLRAAGLEGRVLLAGAREDVPAIMNALDLHVLPSLGEAFPNAVAEAMACGTSCVVTDVGDAARIVGDTGWVVPPRDPDALAAAINQALTSLDSQGRPGAGERCRARIVRLFSLERMTEAYRSLWIELAAPAGGMGH